MKRWGSLAVLVAFVAGSGVAEAQKRPVRLTSFGSCAELLAYARAHATKLATPTTTATPAPTNAPTGGREASDDFSTTNVQEASVDEPDIVKTDGQTIFTIANGKLHAVAARGQLRLLDSLTLEQGWSHELLVSGDRALVLSQGGGGVVEPLPGPQPGRPSIAPVVAKSLLTEVDVSSPSALRVLRTLTVEGQLLTARLVGRSARVVVHSFPAVPDPAKARQAKLSAWLPDAVLANRRTGTKSTRSLVQCRSVRRAPVFSGLGVVTVLTIDLARGLPAVDADSVLTDGQVVYASRENLYVATQRWLSVPADRSDREPPTMTTAVHKFDISRPDRTDYRGSGEVRGFVLNQWSLSEHRGFLRVATTDLPVWWRPGPRVESESFVSVLEDRAGKLVEVGRVGELGRGERIYAVRFIGDVGYVVTFRQVDPLYTLDLAAPKSPRVLGELKIQGYSAYLHPVGDDLLLGIGQDADDEGRVRGAQVSLFDVSDLRTPKRLDAFALGAGSSEAEYDHHAFLWWPRTSLAVLPVQLADSTKRTFAGAIGLRVGRAAGIREAGRVAHPGGAIRRSLVVGDRLFTVSERGIRTSTLESLHELGWLAL